MNHLLFGTKTPIAVALIALLVFLGNPSVSQTSELKDSRRPDILLVIADDMDFSHFGFRHPAAKTPTLDRLVQEGTLFEQGWMAPRCAPSLASILTGLHPHEHGRYFNSYGGPKRKKHKLAPASGFSLPLSQSGYRCFMGGKWWFSSPKEFGFEGSDSSRSTFARTQQKGLFKWLDSLKSDDSFFLWWAPLLPHTPHNPRKEHLAAIDRTKIPVPDHLSPHQKKDFLKKEHIQLAMTKWFDDSLNDLLSKLASAGRRENLLTIFCIDNGWSNGFISKGSLYERALQTPFVFHHPVRVPAGKTHPQLVSVTDLYPTILDYAEVTFETRSDGKSIKPLIEGKETDWRSHVMAMAFPKVTHVDNWKKEAYSIAIRGERWKLIRYLRSSGAIPGSDLGVKSLATFPLRALAKEEFLFDLEDGGLELSNLILDDAGKADRNRLQTLLDQWWLESTGESEPNEE